MNEIESSFYKDFYKHFENQTVISNDNFDCTLITRKYDDPKIYDGLCIYSELTIKWYKDVELLKGQVMLMPQMKIDKYFIDFYLCGYLSDYGPAYGIGLEVDGHEWHEKTKEQVSKDKKRERKILMEGIPLLRYTGSEVYKDVKSCILESITCYLNFVFNDYYSKVLRDRKY